MNSTSGYSSVQIVLPIVTLLGLVAAFFFGSAIANENYFLLGAIVLAALATTWVVAGRNAWWTPLLFFACLGGYFYVGFKIYTHEVAVLVCLLPLLITLAMNRANFVHRSFKLSGAVIILFLYMVLHLIACMIYNKVSGLGGEGNVLRRYVDALWPLMVFIPFVYFGSTKYVTWALRLMAIALLARFSLGLVSFFDGSESVYYIPGLNYVPAGGFGNNDLRLSGYMLTAVLLCYFCMTKSFFLRMLLSLLITISVIGTFLGGGRIISISMFILFGFICLVYRRYDLMGAIGAAGIIAVMLLNANPHILYSAPDAVRRAGTAFLFDRDLAADTGATGASDEFHSRLITEGYKSWTQDLFTFLFGRGVRPIDMNAWAQDDKSLDFMVEMATITSRFEKGLWEVLCTFGLVGFVLYAAAMITIIRKGAIIIFRERIKSPSHAFIFLGVYLNVVWFLLCWISDTFPSFPLMLGLIALIAANDLKEKQDRELQAAATPVPPKPLTV